MEQSRDASDMSNTPMMHLYPCASMDDDGYIACPASPARSWHTRIDFYMDPANSPNHAAWILNGFTNKPEMLTPNLIKMATKEVGFDHIKISHMPWQQCCHGMCEILLWSIKQHFWCKVKKFFLERFLFRVGKFLVEEVHWPGLWVVNNEY